MLESWWPRLYLRFPVPPISSPRLCEPFHIISLQVSFSPQYYLLVFHWSLNDSKYPKVSKTLYSILAVLSNSLVGIVSFPPVPSPSSSKCTNNNWYYLDPHIPHFFSVHWQGLQGISLLKSPGLFPVLWLILVMLECGWSLLIFLFQSPSVPVPILYSMNRMHHPKLISPSHSCFIIFQFSSKVMVFISLFVNLQSDKIHSVFSWLFLCSVTQFVSQNPRVFRAFHFLGHILCCAYSICSYDQIWTTCPIPSRSSSSTSCV